MNNRLSRLMGERRVSIRQVALATGIAYSTLHALYHDRTKGIDFLTLEKLCRHFGVGTQEILEHVTDAQG